MNVDWLAIWGVVGPAVVGLATYLQTRKPKQAAIESAVAQARAEGAVADAQGAVYNLLRQEIDALHTEVVRLRAYVARLERALRESGLELPTEEIKAGGTD